MQREKTPNTNTLNVISWSGGFDSTIMLHYLLYSKDLEEAKVVFVDSTLTIPETLRYIKEIVKLFGIENKFITLRPELNFWDKLEKTRFWPMIRALWCTYYLKRRPLLEWYRAFDVETIFDHIGVSIFDSPHRAKRYQNAEFNYKLKGEHGEIQVIYKYPIIFWKDKTKERYAKNNHIPQNPIYKTFGLSGCWYCPFLHEKDYLRLKHYYPKLFYKICAYERFLCKRALPDFWVSSLAPQQHITNYLEENACVKKETEATT